jgi:hypothetical protein
MSVRHFKTKDAEDDTEVVYVTYPIGWTRTADRNTLPYSTRITPPANIPNGEDRQMKRSFSLPGDVQPDRRRPLSARIDGVAR